MEVLKLRKQDERDYEVSGLQIVAQYLGIKDLNNISLCTLIQGKIQELKKEVTKKDFANNVLHNNIVLLKNEIKGLKAKLKEMDYLDEIQENFNKILKAMKKENNELKEALYQKEILIKRYEEIIKRNEYK